MNINSTLLYTFFAILQIYILFSVEVIIAMKKKISDQSSKMITQLIFVIFFPTFGIIEITRMASWPNIETLWYLILSSFISEVLGFLICKIIHFIFGLDIRISNIFCSVVSLPSLGAMSFVI